MTVIRSEEELKDKLLAAASVSPEHPVGKFPASPSFPETSLTRHVIVISKFIEGAQEIDVDGVASEGKLLIHAVSEHVENAGVHSGDATLVLPPVNLEQGVIDGVKDIAEKVAKAWSITGPFNMQVCNWKTPPMAHAVDGHAPFPKTGRGPR